MVCLKKHKLKEHEREKRDEFHPLDLTSVLNCTGKRLVKEIYFNLYSCISSVTERGMW